MSSATHAIPSQALKSLVPTDHIVFGSDFPFRTCLDHVRGMEAAKVYTAEELRGIYSGNVTRLLPELMR